MALENIGSISYDARISTSDFDKDADKVERRAGEVASSVEKSGNRGFRGFASSASESLNTVADGLGRVLRSALVIGTSGSAGMGAMALASWNQVSAVQQATLALNAYEKDGNKVNKVLSELVAYARSDMGVLFNRKDLFAAAQQLRIMGDNTDYLTDHVKIMSRSVGLGLSTWEGLGNVINRVGSTGMLYADDLKYLQNAGFKLDSTMSGTTQTFESLFKALDKGIPAEAMAGQATTIVGLGVRMQTAFRNLGDAILGVDADSGKFVKDGLGDKLVGMMGKLTMLLKDPALKEGFKKMGLAMGEFAEGAMTAVIKGFTWIVTNINAVVAGIAGLAAAFVAVKAAAIGADLLLAVNPMMLLAEAIAVSVAGLTYLQIRFQYVTKAIDIMQPSMDLIIQTVSDMIGRFGSVGEAISGVGKGKNVIAIIRNSLIALNATIIRTGVFIKQMYYDFANSSPMIILSQFIQQVVLPALKAIGAAIKENLMPALGQLWDSVTRLLNALNPALTYALILVAGIIGGVLLTATWLITGAINIFVQVLSMLISVVSNVISWISNLVGWFGNLVAIALNTISTIIIIFRNLVPAIRDVVFTIAAVFKGLGEMILDAIGDTGRILFDAGKKLIDGFIKGIKDKFGDVKNTLGDLTGKLTSWKGPASVDKVILKQSGQMVIGGFINGLESMYGSVHRSLGSLTNSIGAPSVSSPTASTGGLDTIDSARSADSSTSSVSINVNMSGIMARSKSDERDIAKSLVRRINDELAAKGEPLIAGGAI